MKPSDPHDKQVGAAAAARLVLTRSDANATTVVHSQSGDGAVPAVAIVIAAYEAAETIGTTLAGFFNQTPGGPSFEVVIVDDSSPDDTANIAADRLRTRPDIAGSVVRNNANLGVSRARGIGVHRTTAPYILFFDSDDEPNRGYVASHLRVLTASDAPTASFASLTPEAFGQDDDVRVGLSTLQCDGPNTVFNIIPWVGAGSIGMPRSVFEQLGGFESAMIGAEDVELCIRMWQAGVGLVAAPGAVCRIRTRETPGAVFRQRKAYAIAHVAIAREHWSMLDPIRFGGAQVKAIFRIPAILIGAARAYVAGGPARFEAADAIGSLVGYVVGSVRYRRPVLTIFGNSLQSDAQYG